MMDDTQNCLSSSCPIEYTLDRIGGKWSIPILRELFSSPQRTHQLQSALPGISTKTLMVRLRDLEDHGLVERQVFAEVPLHVEYSITEKGQQIQPVLAALYQVGQQWLEQEDCHCPLNEKVG
ncbi:helix-turn-helix transcriptional regulator [Acaryochloris marina S15]|nr:helix-turn-helix domain-containing protein [Acaryochloris marina]QUY41429.1 helix-turn-helix transcriptional regulator [Acaryochloris marina S15]